MTNKIRKICDNIFANSKTDIGYYVVLTLHYIFNLLLFILLGYIYDNYTFIIVCLIVTTVINNITYTHHCHILENCTWMTQVFIIIFGFISKTIPLEWSFLISLFCMRDIYLRCPLQIVHIEKDESWHKRMALFCLMIFMTISIVTLYFNLIQITQSILWSISICDFTLIQNNDKKI